MLFKTTLTMPRSPHAVRAPLKVMFDTARLKRALPSAGPALLFGLRLWVSVCLALYIAFRLELDDPAWAGTAAAIVCQPTLGASLRKSWFRMVGTITGGIAIVVLTACFPQNWVATVDPIFTWVRLAQRIPVRIHIDQVPPGIVLSAGMTATVEIKD